MELLTKIFYFFFLITLWKFDELRGEDAIFDQYSITESDEFNFIDESAYILKTFDDEASRVYKEDVVIVFGTAKSGKSLLVKFITGDNSKLVSSSSDGKSWEILNSDLTRIHEPDLLNLLHVDIKEGTPYFEFPGFNNDETFSYDLTWKYYTWRIINQAKALKFILTVSYSSESNSIINTTEFLDLVQHIAGFIKNVKKFSESFALVVTNLENPHSLELSILRKKIAESLLHTSKILAQKGDKQGEKFVVDLLTHKGNETYNKIGFLTRPRAEGLVSKMYSLQHEKLALNYLIKNAINFADADNSDFNYEPPQYVRTREENKQFFDAFMIQMERRINTTRHRINSELLRYFENHERNVNDIRDLKEDFKIKDIDITELMKSIEITMHSDNNHLQIRHDKKVLMELGKLIGALKIRVSKENFINILHSYKYLEFIKAFSNQSNWSFVQNWEIKEIHKFLEDSEKWYTFLDDLRSLFSDFQVQISRDGYQMNIAEIDDVCRDKKQLTNMEEGLRKFAERHYLHENIIKNVFKSYQKIRSMNISDVKREYLCKVYNMTLLEELQMDCLGNTLQIKREFIRFDQIPPSNYCQGGVKRLELFAFNTLIINTDLNRTGEELEVVAIAPKWIVDNERMIILDGLPAKEHDHPKAPDSYTPGFDGHDGLPGFPGGPAGSFLGIGTEISGITKDLQELDKTAAKETLVKLVISAEGGNGGKGQDGGNGAKGENGAQPTELKDSYRISSELDLPKGDRVDLKLCEVEGSPEDKVCFSNVGTKGHPNGDGGNGGKGGLPGSAGSIHLFLPQNSRGVHLIKYNETGVAGQGGMGGQGGYGSIDGITRYVLYNIQQFRYPLQAPNFVDYIKSHELIYPRVALPKGKDGLSDNNTDGRENAECAAQTQFPQSVNRYKTFLREMLNIGISSSEKKTFYARLNDEGPLANGNSISDLNDVLSLADELQGLEEQYFKMHNQLDFLPFYKSLLHRVQVYTKNLKTDKNVNEYKKILTYLYSGILSKICNLANMSQNSLIIDIRKYLASALEEVQNSLKSSKEMKRNIVNKNLKIEIDNKIKEANQFAKLIQADVRKINKQLHTGLETLTNRTINDENTAKDKVKEDEKRKEDAKRRLALHAVFESLKAIALVASFCGPWGAITGGIVETALTYAEPFALDKWAPEAKKDHIFEKSGQLVLSARKHIDTITDLLWKSQEEAMKKNIETLRNKENELKDLSSTREKLEDILQKADPLADENVLDESQRAIEEAQENTKASLKELKESEAAYKKKKEVLASLQGLEKVNRVFKLGYQISKDLKTKESQVQEIQKDIEIDQQKVRRLDAFQDEIRGMIMPMLRSMKQEVVSIENSLRSKTHVALDMTKWQVQQTFTNIKLRLKRMMQEFPQVAEQFGSLVQKLMDTLNTLINIYDRMQQYQDRMVMVDYIAEMNSPNMKYLRVDEKLNYALSYLKVVLDINTMLDPYQRTINAFQQYAFPFAQFYMAEFNLPSDLKLSDMQSVQSHAIYVMTRLSRNLDQNAVLVVPGMDEYIHEGDFSTASEFSGPFFVWKNSEHKLKIGELLSGREIILTANIEEGLQKNAVKFKTIKLEFMAINPKLQEDLNKDLRKFQVTMTHMGNSYYRCDGKYYIITSNKQTISYTFQKNSYSSNPVQTSLSYSKLQHGDFVLSPYTLWKIKLEKNSDISFDELHRYRHQVDIALTGYGRYVDSDVGICDSDLAKYYKEETSIFELDALHL